MEVIDLSTTNQQSQIANPGGLRSLPGVKLNDAHQLLLDQALRLNGGDTAWQSRKQAEARDVLALSQIAPPGRLWVEWIDMADALRILLHLDVPVARKPDSNNELQLAYRAVLGLTYHQEAVQRPLPGTAFFDVMDPRDAWHANIGPLPPIPEQLRIVLCLGTEIPAGMRCSDLVVMAYGAFSMQTVQVDERDPAGILNFEAARWWQQNMHRIPLTKTPFLQVDKNSTEKNAHGPPEMKEVIATIKRELEKKGATS